MVIDTSAIVAILLTEPEARRLAKAIEAAPVRRISAATLLEASIVLEKRYGFSGSVILDQFLAITAMQI